MGDIIHMGSVAVGNEVSFTTSPGGYIIAKELLYFSILIVISFYFNKIY
jgi:hypothetical protein